MEDADLKALFAATFNTALPSDACPSAEEIYEAYHKVVPSESLNLVLDHIAGCPVCADSWRLASRTDAPPESS